MRNRVFKQISSIFSTHKYTLLLFSLIFIIFAFFRFYNLHLRIPFAWDQEQFSTQVRDIITDHKFTLLGPRVTDDRGFFLAPYFTYLLIPFFLITNLHPQALTVFTIVVNLIFFVSAAYIISRLFSLKHSLLFLFLWTFNPILVRYDTTPWWPILIPLGVLLIWYELYAIYKMPKNPLFWMLLGLTIGFFCNMHFQFVFIGAFSLVFLLVSFARQLLKYWAGFTIAAASFFIMFSPLLVFDLRHNNLNINLFMNYFSERVLDDKPYIEAWQQVFGNFIRPLTGTSEPIISMIFLILCLLLCSYFIFQKKGYIRIFYVSTLLLIIFTVLGFSLYGRRPSEYYFTFLIPFFLIGISELLVSINNKAVIAGLLVLLLYANAFELKNSVKEDDGGLYYKDRAIQKIIPYIQNKKFNVSYDMPLGVNNGYDYLLNYHHIKGSGDWSDPLIQLRIPPQRGDIIVKNIGVYIPPELKY